MQHNQCLHKRECTEKSCVHRVPIFSNLTEEEMDKVLMTISHKNYKKGETIYLEGEIAERLIVINKGKVKISKATEDGKEQIIRILNAGDFMGELSLFAQYPLKNNADSLEDTSVCIIDSEKIHGLIENNPSIALKIIKELSLRLGRTEELIESIGLRDVEQRLADILLKSADEKNIVKLSISKKDLAAHMGMSKETLSRKLSSFQEKGFISQEGQRKIIILNRKALEEISGI